MRCELCEKLFREGEMVFYNLHKNKFLCQQCSEKENLCYRCHEWPVIKCGDSKQLCEFCRKELNIMPNIKITAEVDGKQVPLENISTETFEAIKALEKPKEIPVARIGNYRGEPNDRRLFLKITNSIKRCIIADKANIISIKLKDGYVGNWWRGKEMGDCELYENIKPL